MIHLTSGTPSDSILLMSEYSGIRQTTDDDVWWGLTANCCSTHGETWVGWSPVLLQSGGSQHP